MVKLIIIRGYPGSGKTTVGKRLEEMGVGRFINHNSILTFIANIAGDDEGIYDDIANLELAIAKKLLEEKVNVIVARGFSGLESLRAYEDVGAEVGAEVTIVRLVADIATLSERVASEERFDDFNPTVTKEALLKWVGGNPIIDHLSEVILDSTRPLEEVVRDILSATSGARTGEDVA